MHCTYVWEVARIEGSRLEGVHYTYLLVSLLDLLLGHELLWIALRGQGLPLNAPGTLNPRIASVWPHSSHKTLGGTPTEELSWGKVALHLVWGWHLLSEGLALVDDWRCGLLHCLPLPSSSGRSLHPVTLPIALPLHLIQSTPAAILVLNLTTAPKQALLGAKATDSMATVAMGSSVHLLLWGLI